MRAEVLFRCTAVPLYNRLCQRPYMCCGQVGAMTHGEHRCVREAAWPDQSTSPEFPSKGSRKLAFSFCTRYIGYLKTLYRIIMKWQMIMPLESWKRTGGYQFTCHRVRWYIPGLLHQTTRCLQGKNTCVLQKTWGSLHLCKIMKVVAWPQILCSEIVSSAPENL